MGDYSKREKELTEAYVGAVTLWREMKKDPAQAKTAGPPPRKPGITRVTKVKGKAAADELVTRLEEKLEAKKKKSEKDADTTKTDETKKPDEAKGKEG